jgi:catechol 2,3-dioxygenase-like lactoylglutathione lyase family enzyme
MMGNEHPGFSIGRLGHLALGTRDLDAMLEHYCGRLGLALTDRSADAVYLTVGPEHHCLTIEKGAAGHLRTGFQINGSLEDAERALRAHGIATERRSEPEPGIADALILTSPDKSILALYERQAPSGVAPVHELRPRKLGHVARFTDDLTEIRRFYLDGLGLRFGDSVAVDGRDFFLFMRVGPDHHTVNFMENPQESGLHHFAFEARDIDHVKNLLDSLAREKVTLEWGVGRHGPGHNIFSYHRDPDGNLVEIFTDLDLMYDEELGYYEPRPWHEEYPQRPKAWERLRTPGNAWGPGPIDPELLKPPAWVKEAMAAA